MDVEILARMQFAFTIMFHYIYPPLSIGLGLLLVIIEGIYMKTGDQSYLRMARFWTKMFAVTFAIGVATGIVMEFEFGTNWASYSRYVGDVFGSALAAEGVFAFFLESGFLALLLFGWERISPRLHYFSTIMVCLGAHFSAIWIVVANSWMQTPAGFHIVGDGLSARAEIIDFWAMVFNPSSVDRLLHTIVGAWLAGAFLVISVSAYYLLKGRHKKFAVNSLRVALMVAGVSVALQAVIGDMSARGVAKNQPMKLAAMEGIYQTQKGAPLVLFGVPDSEAKLVKKEVSIPKFLSFLSFHDFNAEIKGLNEVPRADWPNVKAVFTTYRMMLFMWGLMVVTVILAWWKWRKGTLAESKGVLRLMAVSVIFPQVANQAGWVAAEMGRYPWIVQDLLRISEGLSKSVSAEHVLGSLIMFTAVYLFLFFMFLYLFNEKIKHGPDEPEAETPYHSLHVLAERFDNE
ncbi:cytochrome d ubiquinol oxidase subunit 1 [Waddlia chondrophila 2032/99]|uniref:Cytochrome d ubiquinol oxidase subunit 1 n=2 Tax=Waddlia chondrophila TaxID=71667 RepID=F8LCE1_9BACT|nr:cytochrome ubiquinol oxidase subunit I [Waddlia chondrophila]ADI38152.1 putative cytochrome d ubiquinol oxidase subunit 1 [Waddlia chondrophila WSU 86-1044]CCB91155.1 cytochrome d ubiquinol oxidase subunit 1 [Waddlia chondrophila 2032/99]